MFKMSHLGPHTFVSQDHHHRGHEWLSHFNRDERHRLVQEDFDARNHVAAVLFTCMGAGLLLMVSTLIAVATG
jgi:hypothetical protein